MMATLARCTLKGLPLWNAEQGITKRREETIDCSAVKMEVVQGNPEGSAPRRGFAAASERQLYYNHYYTFDILHMLMNVIHSIQYIEYSNQDCSRFIWTNAFRPGPCIILEQL